jgi:hypothetical protein
VDGVLAESQPITAQWSIPSLVVYGQDAVTLANGDNTISVPTGTRLIIIIPPATVQFQKILKGAGGDTGTSIDRFLAVVHPYTSSTLIVNSAGLETVPHRFIFLG